MNHVTIYVLNVNFAWLSDSSFWSQGRIQDFHWGGGGGRKRLCARTHIMIADPEVQSPLFDALSCYLSLIFKHSDINWDKKHTTLDQILGGPACCAPQNPPPWTGPRIALSAWTSLIYNKRNSLHTRGVTSFFTGEQRTLGGKKTSRMTKEENFIWHTNLQKYPQLNTYM